MTLSYVVMKRTYAYVAEADPSGGTSQSAGVKAERTVSGQ